MHLFVCQYFNFVDFGLIIQCRLLVGVRGPGESGTADSCLSTIDVECATIAIFQDNMTYYTTACIHIRKGIARMIESVRVSENCL